MGKQRGTVKFKAQKKNKKQGCTADYMTQSKD